MINMKYEEWMRPYIKIYVYVFTWNLYPLRLTILKLKIQTLYIKIQNYRLHRNIIKLQTRMEYNKIK